MRILFLNHSPGRPLYDASSVEKKLNAYASPGTTVEIGFPDKFPGAHLESEGGENNLVLHHLRVPALMAKIVWAQEHGYDAVIQSNTYDPGVEAARFAVRIPVIGLLRTSMHVGLNLADRIGITIGGNTALPALERHVWRILRAYKMDHFVTAIRPLEGAYTNASSGNKSAIFDIAVRAIKELVDDTGAEIVLPLGGAIIPYIVDTADLAEATGVQVLNTKAIGIQFAEMCVRLGLTQSAVTYPPTKLVTEDFLLEV